MPSLDLASNCGGNNAARAYVSEYALMMIMSASENPNQEFSLESATTRQRNELANGPSGWGVGNGDILICTKPLQLNDPGARHITVVCSRPFTNVPRYLFRRASPRHAIAYSDGGTALVTVKEFGAIDRPSFVPASELNLSTR